MRTIGEDVRESMLPDCVCRRRDDLEAEVARLREELTAAHEREQQKRVDYAQILAVQERDLHAERAAHEQTRAELERWRTAWGGDFGPQTPDEVSVFLRESERVQGQVSACEIAKALARVAELEQKNEGLERACYGDGRGAHAEDLLKLQAAESALASARTLLVDWESYDPDDQDCEWYDRRTAWLAANPTPGAEKGAGT